MGLIKSTFTAASSAISSTLADQWKEYFALDSMEKDMLVCRGTKVVNGKSANDSANQVISDGSGISVADGQCAVIVEQGKIVEFTAEPGVYTYRTNAAPSIFTGPLDESVKNSFRTIVARFTMGGGTTGVDQRVYYLNLKEILDNRFGTATPIPFRVVGRNQSFDLDTSVKCNGQFSYRIVDPVLFYSNVCGNVSHHYRRSGLDSTLKSELLTALQPAFGQISAKGIRYSDLPSHTMEISESLNQILSNTWTEIRGIKIISFAINSVSIPKEDAELIRQLQLHETPNLAAANLAAAQAEAMKTAAGNSAGSLHGFMGMNIAGAVGAMGVNPLFQSGMQNPTPPQGVPPQGVPPQGVPPQGVPPQGVPPQGVPPQAAPTPPTMASQGEAQEWQCDCGTANVSKFCSHCGSGKPLPKTSWTCSCQTINSSHFCSHCGKAKPQDPAVGWTCVCGALNPGRFCQDCGTMKPIGAPLYRCDKCGYNPEDPHNPPKFCPECGDSFGDEDIIK